MHPNLAERRTSQQTPLSQKPTERTMRINYSKYTNTYIMKKMLSGLLFCLAALIHINAHAQAPQAFPYQAVARDISGNLIANQSVSLRFSVLQGSSTGTVLYQEKHTITSTSLGLCNVNIGQGVVLNGTFASINWGNGAKFIKVELDPAGGNNFTVMGTTQLLSVPYAMYANVPGVAGPAGANGNSVLNGTTNPTTITGVNGDFYINTTSNQLFGPKTAGVWGSGISLVGPQGAQGPQGIQGLQGLQGVQGVAGTNGTNGKTILNGSTNPVSGQGVDGDFFINTATKQLFGPKTAGSWGSGTSLLGPQGAQGIQGLQGPQGIPGPPGASGAQGIPGVAGTNGTNGTNGNTVLSGSNNPTNLDGVDGDFFINTSSNEIFGPKAAGVWGAGTSLVGPQGPAGGMSNGTATGNTTFWNGTTWVVNDNFLYNDGSQVGIGNPTPAPSAVLDISSTNKGFLMPRMTTLERNAITSPAVGLQIYNLDDHCIDLYDGTSWRKTCGLKSTGSLNDPNHALPNTWALKSGIASARSNAVAFTIGNKAYLGLGTFLGMSYFNDFYEYDPATDTWTQKANFPPGARADAVGFSINGKGYITTGGNGVFVNYDMWEYDPVTDAWTQKSNCPGSARSKAQGFAIGNMGYVGLGTDGVNDLTDFWAYNPATDSWTQKASYPGLGRTSTMGLVINNMGYIGLGTDVNGNYYGDVWEYNAGADAWSAKQSFAGSAFHSMSCFAMNGKGYVGTGFNGINELTDFWEYDAVADTWTSKAMYSGAARKNGVGFSIGNKGYIATGIAGLVPMSDMWEYMDINITGNSYVSTSINTLNNSINDGAWTVYNNKVYNSNSGNVGIGTSSPTSKLTVAGDADISGEIKANGVSGLAGQVLQSNGNGTMSWVTNTGGGGGSSPWAASGNDISNTNTGNVGIGSMPSFNAKLYVSGNEVVDGNSYSDLADNTGALIVRSVGATFSQIRYLKVDGQKIQAVSHNPFIFPTPAPSASNLYLNSLGGNVGIRTTAANATLSVARGTGVDGTAAFIGTNHISHFNYSTAEDTYIRGGKNGSKVFINDGAQGPVVIGSVSSFPAGYKLFVDDGILTERLKVAVNGSGNWADYVFADDYKLMSLEEVEAFVKEHKHLPNVPSAEAMVESGIDVATVDAKLMEKIEELTLYILDLQKQINQLKNEK